MVNFDISNVAGNPLYLGSIVLAFIGWFIMLVGDGIAANRIGSSALTWWLVIFEFLFNVGVLCVLSTDTLRQYRVVLVGCLAISVVYLSNHVNAFIGLSDPGFQASSAGGIFLLIVHFVWLIVFGSSDDSYILQVINSWSVPSKPSQGLLSMPTQYQGGSFAPQQGIQMGSVNMPVSTAGSDLTSTVVVSPNAQYTYKARALYAYDANIEDPNELSFVKGEQLDIVDNKGKWWQARKTDGSVGIAPSNYLQIV